MKRLLGIIIGSLFLLSGTTDDIPPEAVNAKVKAVFLYNFTKYIEWPKNYKSGNFVIAVLGSNPYLLEELNKMAQAKKAGSQNFEIKGIFSLNNAENYHMLFVSPDFDFQIPELTNKLKGKSTLLITEKPGMAKVISAINFVVVSNKQKFELNKNNAEKYNLKVSSNLMSLAILVE